MNADSTNGYMLGYLGGGLMLTFNLILYFIIPDQLISIRITFFIIGYILIIFIGIWWVIFSIPLMIFVKEPFIENSSDVSIFNSVLIVPFKRLFETFKNLLKFKQLLLFLVSFWFYNDVLKLLIL
jgi:UMF1 family MFS transporter